MSMRASTNGLNCIEALLSIQSSWTTPLELHRVEDTMIRGVNSIARRRNSTHTTRRTTSIPSTTLASKATVMDMSLGRETTESTLHVRSIHVHVAQSTPSLPRSLGDQNALSRALEDLAMGFSIGDLAVCKRSEDNLPVSSSLLHRDIRLSTSFQTIT